MLSKEDKARLDSARLYTSVGMNIKQFRTNLKMTQQALANMVGISRVSVSNIEAGRQGMSLYLASCFAYVLKCSLEDLSGPRIINKGNCVNMHREINKLANKKAKTMIERLVKEVTSEVN